MNLLLIKIAAHILLIDRSFFILHITDSTTNANKSQSE